MSEIEYSILGPISVRLRGDGTRVVLSDKLTLLLARLLIEPGIVVSATTLANDIWDEEVELRDPPNSVQRLVSQLRQRLGDTEEPRRILVSVGAAYRIDADPLTIDAERFRLLARRGSALLQRHPRAARSMLEEALAIWRGPVLGGLAELRWVAAAATELEALRDIAEVGLNEALFALGEFELLESSLRGQLAARPTDERRHAQLIRVLEQMGREAEAGLAYREAVHELGAPGRELRRLGERIGRGLRTSGEPARSAAMYGPRERAVFLQAILDDSATRADRGIGTAALLVDREGGEPYPASEHRLVGVFEDPEACSRAALALAREPRLRCATGVHCGGLVQLGARLAGPGPARARLLAEAAYPGQVLVSAAARERPWPVQLRDLGEQRYEDLLRGEPVFELREDESASNFPPPDTLNERPHNLPVQASRMVGRARELASISRSIAAGELITLAGAAGCGKTRLALQLAAHSLPKFEDGAWFAELAELAPSADVEAVALAVVAQLGVRSLREESGREALVRHLSDRSAVLVVDNCEHVLPACAELLVEVRAASPGVCIIATSRRALSLDGERAVEVPAMETEGAAEVDALPDAVELLLERMGPLPDAGADTPDLLADARRICVALDGSPLGIELAASHVAMRGLAGVAVEVKAMLNGERELDLFASRDPGRPSRQRTIEAATRWSHDLLTPLEQAVLRRLAVFSGSFGMAEAQVVASAGELEPAGVADLVSSLVDSSIVGAEPPLAGKTRLRLKQAIRAFAFRELEQSGELDRTRREHAAAYAELAARMAPTLFGPGEQAGLELLEADHDNMRAALAYLVSERRSEEALRLLGALWWLWFSHGHLEEGCGWVEAALALDEKPTQARVRALRVGSHLEWWRGDYARTDYYNQALERCARAIGDAWGLAWAPMGHGAVLLFTDPDRALPLFEESRYRFRALGRDWEQGYAIQLIGAGHWFAGREEAARKPYDEALRIFERTRHGQVLASVRRGAGLMAARCREPERGRALCREALAFSESIGDRSGAAQALNFMASISREQGDLEIAAERYVDALLRARQVGDLWATCAALDGVACVACELAEFELAARLLAQSDVLAERTGYGRPSYDRTLRDIQARKLRSELGQRSLELATAEGALMSVPDAVTAAHAFVRRIAYGAKAVPAPA